MTDPSSYSALATDFYINQRLALKMDLPSDRETILALFDRVRREFPSMTRFRRFTHELALESTPEQDEGFQQWIALRRTSVRTGVINPRAPDTYRIHALTLEIAPYFLSISPLDVDYLELLYGFDIMAAGNHDAIVFDALLSGSPWAKLAAPLGPDRAAIPLDCQPSLAIALSESVDFQAHFEVKTRTSARAIRTGEFEPQPISLYLTLRKYGSIADVRELAATLQSIAKAGEELLDSRVVPHFVMPIRQAVGSTD
ncbi:MAG: hypothetical protein C0468_02770 [Planctomyces sp.]|nr:hypothetical protein [Planctomyces sp.]